MSYASRKLMKKYALDTSLIVNSKQTPITQGKNENNNLRQHSFLR